MLKKVRNVLMIMAGFCLLGPTYIIYSATNSKENNAFWREKLGDWYDTFPYISIPIGVLLILFAVVSALMMALQKPELPRSESFDGPD